jgi:hypothetical protein
MCSNVLLAVKLSRIDLSTRVSSNHYQYPTLLGKSFPWILWRVFRYLVKILQSGLSSISTPSSLILYLFATRFQLPQLPLCFWIILQVARVAAVHHLGSGPDLYQQALAAVIQDGRHSVAHELVVSPADRRTDGAGQSMFGNLSPLLRSRLPEQMGPLVAFGGILVQYKHTFCSRPYPFRGFVWPSSMTFGH